MVSRIVKVLFGTANPWGAVNPGSRMARKIEAIERAELETREAERRAIEKARREEQLEREAVVRKITGGLYGFLTPYFELVRDSHLEQVLRGVEEATDKCRFHLIIGINANFRTLTEGNEGEGSVEIALGGFGYHGLINLKSISQIGPNYDFVYGEFTSRGTVDLNKRRLMIGRSAYVEFGQRDVLKLKDAPIEVMSYKVSEFRYEAIWNGWTDEYGGGGCDRMNIYLDAPTKTIEVVGAGTSSLTPEDLKNPEALENAVIRAYLHPGD